MQKLPEHGSATTTLGRTCPNTPPNTSHQPRRPDTQDRPTCRFSDKSLLPEAQAHNTIRNTKHIVTTLNAQIHAQWDAECKAKLTNEKIEQLHRALQSGVKTQSSTPLTPTSLGCHRRITCDRAAKAAELACTKPDNPSTRHHAPWQTQVTVPPSLPRTTGTPHPRGVSQRAYRGTGPEDREAQDLRGEAERKN
jgi:hypothetical protein